MSLIVYLDASDYLNIFYESDKNGPYHQVLKKLLSFRDRDEITIGYSGINLMEVITKPDDTHKEERVNRGRLIRDICGHNAFPHIPDMINGAVFPNSGRWLGMKDISAEEYKHEIIKDLDYDQRCQLGCEDSIFGRERSDYAGYPISDEVVKSRLLERWLKGKCSNTEFENRMNAWMSDPVEFSRIYDCGKLPDLKNLCFDDMINRFKWGCENVQKCISMEKQINEVITHAKSTLMDAGYTKSKLQQIKKNPPIEIDPKRHKIYKAKFESIFGKNYGDFFIHYLLSVIKPGYIFKQSDILDIIQVRYAYECDLFRCDKKTENIFKNFTPLKGKLVKNFNELPERIGDKLKEVNNT